MVWFQKINSYFRAGACVRSQSTEFCGKTIHKTERIATADTESIRVLATTAG